MRFTSLAVACVCAAVPAAAQFRAVRIDAGPAFAVNDWNTYLQPGVSLTVAGQASRLMLAVGVTRFAPTTVSRPYQGTGAPVAITNGSSVLSLVAGPAVSLGRGRVTLDVSAGGGVARFHTTSRAVLPGAPDLVDRANTFDDLTWTASAGADLRVRIGRGRLALVAGVRGVRTGPVRIVREDLLAVGTISGLYIRPVPTPGTWLGLTLGVQLGR